MKTVGSSLAIGAGLAIAAGAAADTIYLGTSGGSILAGDAVAGNFAFLGVCGGPVHSMTVQGKDLLVGDKNGTVYRIDTGTGLVTDSFGVKSDAAAMAMYGPDLLIGGTSGSFVRVDPVTKEVKGDWTVWAAINAMAVNGEEVWTGAHDTSVLRVDPDNGEAQWQFACGGSVDSMVVTGAEVLLGTLQKTIYRFDRENNNYLSTFNLPHDAVGMALHEGHLLVAGSNGVVSRVDLKTEKVVGSWDTGLALTALVLVAEKPCAADFNGDGTTDVFDFFAFVNAFNAKNPGADLDQSTGPGVFDLFDYLAFQNQFLNGCD